MVSSHAVDIRSRTSAESLNRPSQERNCSRSLKASYVRGEERLEAVIIELPRAGGKSRKAILPGTAPLRQRIAVH